MVKGDCRVNDLSRLLRSLRLRTFGVQSIKDIADLTAHEDDRDAGMMVEAISDLYYSIKLHFVPIVTRKRLSIGAMPGFMAKALDASFKTLPDEAIRKQTGLKRNVANKMLRAAIANFVTNQDGTINGSKCSAEERRFIEGISGSFRVQPVYDDAVLFRDLRFVLEKNGLLLPSETKALGYVKERLAIFAVSLLHRVDVVLPDATVAELLCQISGSQEGNVLTVMANWPGPEDGVQFKLETTIFQTTLAAADHCGPDVLAAAVPANGIPANPATLANPLEIGPDWKLRLMV